MADAARGDDWLAERFEEVRPRLRAVAYRMLGSLTEADDAVQEAWLRLSRSDAGAIDNLTAWLTTVVGRVSLNMLRSRATRREEPLEVHLAEPIVSPDSGTDPEQQALLADSVGLALLVVMDTLEPAERLAFVLHDMFALPFEEIAPLVGRTPAAARQLASRARRRVQGSNPLPDTDTARQREVVTAFVTAAHGGDFAALLSVLDPEVELRADYGPDRALVRLSGADAVARNARTFSQVMPHAVSRPVLVNGVAGMYTTVDGRPLSLMAFTIRGGRITGIDVIADPDRLARLDVAGTD
jgi:RNA polymerase sigma factor (sigma-70 family)